MKTKLVRVHLICAATLLVCGPVLAQLSPEDISALRERGQAEGWTFTVGENAATAYPLDKLCGAVEPPDWQLKGPFDPCTPSRDLPARFDWRDFRACTPVRNQAGCGSCWAFGAIGSMECSLLLYQHVSEDLSEQWLVSDCCTIAGDCGGGWHTDANNYLKCNGWQDPWGHSGAVLETDFPYLASNSPCWCPYPHPYCIDTWAFVGTPWTIASVSQIKQAILDYGPLSTCVYVNDAFHYYTGGVFNACEDVWINHVVVLVGWDDSQGTNGVWILRNSWSDGWGEEGHMRIEYGCSRIGYATAYVGYGVWEDCNSNTIRDYRDIAWGTSQDCNANLTPDECDIAEGTSQDDNGDGVPDECEIKRPMPEDCATIDPGTRCIAYDPPGAHPCVTDDDCAEESHCVLAPADQPGLGNVCYAPKTRYLSIARNPEQADNTARRIKFSDGTVLGWVGAPWEHPPGSGEWYANVVPAAQYETTWPDVVHAKGCEIAHASLCDISGVHCRSNLCPDGKTCVQHFYHVQAIRQGQDIGNENYYSEALVLHTPSTWGDTCASGPGGLLVPPDGVHNIADILAAISYFQGETGIAPLTWLDIAPSYATQVPDQTVSVTDISGFIAGFQGSPYPGVGPLNCP